MRSFLADKEDRTQMEQKLCVNIVPDAVLSMGQRLSLIRAAGFDGVFACWTPEAPVQDWKRMIRQEGLIFQSMHAPFDHVEDIWEDGEKGEAFLRVLMACVEDCARAEVPLAVVHAIKGFDKHTPSDLGVERFDRLCALADRRGVLLGFENTEGEEYLARILTELRGHPSCRFCWDTGHEMCYNRSRDMMALYGEMLAGTHLNDNEGVTGKEITFFDDAHLLPFDGAADWRGIRERLRKYGFQGPMTFEVRKESRPGRHTHDRYAQLDYAAFMRLAHRRAVQVMEL